MTDFITWEAEYTDTFAGEANYNWVKRAEFQLPKDASNRSIVMRAKKELGLTGARCKTSDFGEGFELRPVGYCMVAFVLPRY